MLADRYVCLDSHPRGFSCHRLFIVVYPPFRLPLSSVLLKGITASLPFLSFYRLQTVFPPECKLPVGKDCP